MKLLVLGLDSGDERIIRELGLPFLTGLMDEGHCFHLEEDLWSRGWVEVLSGAHGRVSGGFYSKPRLDGTHEFTASFGSRDYLDNPHITPIWERLNRQGHRVGMLGLNTTMPAPRVDGFFIAGAGGGYPPTVEVPNAGCWPRELSTRLNEDGYIWEFRYASSGVRDVDRLFEQLLLEVQKRADATIRLCSEFDCDMAFFHAKMPAVLQCLLMSELEALLASGLEPDSTIQRRLLEFYRSFDEVLATLFGTIGADHFMLVSDHASSPYTHGVSFDAFLRVAGFQKQSRSPVQIGKIATRRLLKAVLPHTTQKSLRKHVSLRLPKRDIDWENSRAFGTRYVPGIYINDARFAGPVSDLDRDALVRSLVEALNGTDEAREYGLSARPYRELFPDAPFEALLPDVWVDSPDTIFPVETGAFVHRNENYRRIDSLAGIEQDIYTGIKGRHPILCTDSASADHHRDGDPGDLGLAYHLMERIMNG